MTSTSPTTGRFHVLPPAMSATMKSKRAKNAEPKFRSYLRLHVDVGASYEVPPNVVKSVIREALQSAPELARERALAAEGSRRESEQRLAKARERRG